MKLDISGTYNDMAFKAWEQRAASEGGLQVVPTVGGLSLHWTF